MKKILISSFALSVILTTVSCKTDFDQDVNSIVVTQGDANFSKYVALGNSLTSGYRDGALYSDGQLESYPSMLAAQMQLAGGGAFKQPMMPNNVGGFTNLPGFAGKLTLQVVNGKLSPMPSAPAAALDNVATAGPYQNLGVPGAKSFHLGLAGYGNPAGLATGMANPYFVRFATSGITSVVADAVAQQPTFFSLWIGNNDVLSYATSGGTNVVGGVVVPATDQTGNPNPASYKSNDITDPTVVVGSITNYVNALTAGGAKGVLANIPNVTSIPFFTTVPYNPLTTTVLGSGDPVAGAANVAALNTNLYGVLKSALSYLGAGDRINLLSATQPNPLLIKDVALTDLSTQLAAVLTPSVGAPTATALGMIFGQARQATKDDYILLTTSSVIGSAPTGAPANLNKYGISYPLENQHVLTKAETAKVMTATAAYNSGIAGVASAKGLALVDANAKMQELSKASGLQWDGVKYTAVFVTGGAFSLDGVHLTGRGYAVVANEFIKAINTKYRSTLPQVNPNKYSGVTFP